MFTASSFELSGCLITDQTVNTTLLGGLRIIDLPGKLSAVFKKFNSAELQKTIAPNQSQIKSLFKTIVCAL